MHTGCYRRFVLKIQRDRIFAHIAQLGASVQFVGIIAQVQTWFGDTGVCGCGLVRSGVMHVGLGETGWREGRSGGR